MEDKGMLCPECRSSHTRIIDVRNTDGGRRRRRVCTTCGNRFSTIEILIVKQKKVKEPIQKVKIKKRKIKHKKKVKLIKIVKQPEPDILYECKCGQRYRHKSKCPICGRPTKLAKVVH